MDQKDSANIAYFTVLSDQSVGWTGGLLILNAGGRPLEFQCTLPLRPSRAHEILFGATLREHIIGEVIGPLLVKKCRAPIRLLCCDQRESLTVESRIDCPVALVEEAVEQPLDSSAEGTMQIPLASSHLRVGIECGPRVQALCDKLIDLPDAVEPFERIREAIREAQSQIARAQATNNAHGESDSVVRRAA